MTERDRILAEVRAFLHSEPRLLPGTHLDLDFTEGTLTIAGEVSDVAVKKRLLARAAAHPHSGPHPR